MEAVFVALFGAITSYFAWRSERHAKRVDKKTDTNHGKTPGEYLEMILDVRESQLDLHQSLLEHTEQDARNFEQLAHLIKSSVKPTVEESG